MLVIGVGNPFRKDDGAGPAAARLVREGGARGVRVLIRGGEGADLIECWEGEERVVVVDAMRSGAEPGTVMRIDAAAGPLPVEHFGVSSHSMGVAEAVEIARALGRLPRSLVVYGIEAADTSDGEGLTPAVTSSVLSVAARILADSGGGGD